MKNIKLISFFLISLLFATNVYAASASTSITGSDIVYVGKTSDIYLNLSASNVIEGVDITYSTSGNIIVKDTRYNNGLSFMQSSGNRYIFYAPTPINKNSTIMTLIIEGTAEGTGTITVSKLEATVDGTTVSGGSKTYTVNVKKVVQEESKKEEPKKDDNEPKEEEPKVDEKKEALAEAKTLVETAKSSLKDSDYAIALSKVNALEDSDEKEELLSELEVIKFNIAVNKKCSSTYECEQAICEDKLPIRWVVICALLGLVVVIENVYLAVRVNKRTKMDR